MLETVGMQARGLVQQLDETFPLENPSPYESDREIMYKAGQRDVVEWIIRYMDEKQ
tara:strand:- start:1162 stop:1329 length:168 start_codon:yes stop_codon:yes gene_type:complete